ncbi:MAG: GGDEF domain-containing protein, partial [Sulfuriferula sp.]
EVQALRRDGTAFSAEISISSVKLKNNWHAVAILRDISARKLAEAQLIKLVTTDALTGICNRRRFNEVIGAEISRANRYHKELGLLIFDIDHFKHINDQFGHQAGDQVLIQLSSLVAKSLRNTDVFARWGGEEFTVLVPSCGDACALRLAEKLRVIIENAEFPDIGKVTCSFGITTYRDQDNEEAILKRADDALYRAKAAGRNRVECG